MSDQLTGHSEMLAGRSSMTTWQVALAVSVLVATWVAVSFYQHTALHQDMAEQFVWVHGWQWGYPKHPPLPTWLFRAALEILPPDPALLYGLAALCISLTGVFTFLMARELLGRRLALQVILLWSLQQPFSWRAWLYNHNTVLVMCIAATAWCGLVANKRSDWRWWLGAGVAAGLALLTKAQALVPLAGIAWALWRSDAFQSVATRRGIVMAAGIGLLLCVPWLSWVIVGGHNDVFIYASHQLGGGEHADGGPANMQLLPFLTVQLRMLAPALLVLLTWIWMATRQPETTQRVPRHLMPTERGWLEGLCLVPLLGILTTGVASGAKLHGQWGVQTFQFAAIALVLAFRPLTQSLSSKLMLRSVLIVQAIGLAAAMTPGSARLHAPGLVMGYPGHLLAEQLEHDWGKTTNCPLRYVIAPFVEGGQVSAFASHFPAVLEDGQSSKSPWINMADLAESGSVILVHDAADLPPGAIHEPHMILVPPAYVRFAQPIVWAIWPPKVDCKS